MSVSDSPQPKKTHRKEILMTDNLEPNVLKDTSYKFPIVLKKMTDSETREYHIKRLYQLCLKWKDKNK